MKKPKSKARGWGARMPYIKDMMRTMTDEQIAKQYNVTPKAFRAIRKYHGEYRKGEPLSIRDAKKPEPLPLKWNFHQDNLPI